MRPWIAVLYAPGINCEVETMEAVRLAGGNPHLIFLRDICDKKVKITDCDVLIVPGGFSYGDHVETGVAVATFLQEEFLQLQEKRIPVLGICNGCQILVRAGLLGQGIAMAQNKLKVFCSRPIRHRVLPSNCIWTKGLEGEILQFPSAHGYGRVVVGDDKINVVMEYAGISPNGGRIAMITDNTGLIAVLMDHPERPFDNPDGLKIFRNGVVSVS